MTGLSAGDLEFFLGGTDSILPNGFNRKGRKAHGGEIMVWALLDISLEFGTSFPPSTKKKKQLRWCGGSTL